MSIHEHLATGTTTVCRCWAVRRQDGVMLGFTDHDEDLAFGDTTFRADSGMTARAFQQSTGLSVDNSEAVGALSDDAIRAADLEAGRYDDAAVTMWLVNWRNPAERSVRFAGTIGEVARSGESFRAELRGLAEGLNKAQGMVFQRTCSPCSATAAARSTSTRPSTAPSSRSTALPTARPSISTRSPRSRADGSSGVCFSSSTAMAQG